MLVSCPVLTGIVKARCLHRSFWSIFGHVLIYNNTASAQHDTFKNRRPSWLISSCISFFQPHIAYQCCRHRFMYTWILRLETSKHKTFKLVIGLHRWLHTSTSFSSSFYTRRTDPWDIKTNEPMAFLPHPSVLRITPNSSLICSDYNNNQALVYTVRARSALTGRLCLDSACPRWTPGACVLVCLLDDVAMTWVRMKTRLARERKREKRYSNLYPEPGPHPHLRHRVPLLSLRCA